MKKATGHLIFTLYTFLCTLEASCHVAFVRYNGREKYLLDKDIQATNCSYTEVVKALHVAKSPVGLHHAVFRVGEKRALVTDTDHPNDQNRTLWKLLDGSEGLPALDETFNQKYKYLGPLPTADQSKRTGLINIKAKTCYANAFLQCLAHIPHFYFRLGSAVKIHGEHADPVATSMWPILKGIHAGTQPIEAQMNVFVSRLSENLQDVFLAVEGEFIQSDSAEVLTSLIGHLNQSLTNAFRPNIMRNGGMFDDLFGIFLHEQRVHDTTETEDRDLIEHMLTLKAEPRVIQQSISTAPDRDQMRLLRNQLQSGIPLNHQEQVLYTELQRRIPQSTLSLETMILALTEAEETLRESGKVATTITRQIKALPPYLFVNFSRSGHEHQKDETIEFRLDDSIDFPVEYN